MCSCCLTTLVVQNSTARSVQPSLYNTLVKGRVSEGKTSKGGDLCVCVQLICTNDYTVEPPTRDLSDDYSLKTAFAEAPFF